MRTEHNLGRLEWTVAGWTPYVWRQQRSIESGVSLNAEVPAIPATVPGSVQGALRAAGILPDWNVGLNARLAEWVENRHWIYTTHLPDDWLAGERTVRLQALGLDYGGWVLLNGKEIDAFTGSLLPHSFDLTPHLRREGYPAEGPVGGPGVVLQIVFDCPPRWLGQIGYTSKMTAWKPRFNYFWDWTSRLVQIGIWDDLLLTVTDGQEITAFDPHPGVDLARGTGSLHLSGAVGGDRGTAMEITLEGDTQGVPGVVRNEVVSVESLTAGITWDDLPVELWWPNGQGDQPLYTVRCRLLDGVGRQIDERSARLGFASIAWQQCEGAPPEADPWICAVNGRPVFLQGVNWTPIRPNFADVSAEKYRALLQTYRDLGCTMLRVWGGAFLEKEVFYDLCDELGLLVWQEFPLSSSGLDNWPPEDPMAIEEMASIARSYIERRRHHVSLALWCGGNELTDRTDWKPVDERHPMIARLAEVVAEHDPDRRFLPTSPSGPSFGAEEKDFGKGIHWDVHGPWRAEGKLEGDWTRYWRNNDALFHSEIGAPGASSCEIIRTYKGDLPEAPGTRENPLWRRQSWWIEWPVFVEEEGREPASLEEFVGWNQERQRRALAIAARSARGRFPRCGGFLIWMGHDSFPCTANTSIIDFHGKPKPAALTVGEIFRGESSEGESNAEPRDRGGE